jgi:hypothetical protein
MTSNIEYVYLVFYHDGYTDDWRVLLGVCATTEIADAVIAKHKDNKEFRRYEYKDRASWNIEKHEVITKS